MKLKYEFAIRQIAGEQVLIPMGSAALKFSGMVTTNEVGAFICQVLKEETDREVLLAAICAEFEVDADTARQDMDAFLQNLDRAGLLA